MKLSKLITFINETIEFTDNLNQGALSFIRFFHHELSLKSIHIYEINNQRVSCHLSFPENIDFMVFPSHLLIGSFNKYDAHVIKTMHGYSYNISLKDYGLFSFLTEQKLDEKYFDNIINVVTLFDYIFYALKKEHYLEAKLRQERNLFQNIIDTIPDLIAYKDKTNTYRVVNEAAKKHYKSEIIGKKIDEIYPKDEADYVKKLDQEIYQTMKSKRRTIPVYTSFGFFQADSIRSPMIDENRNVEGIVSIARDVSDVMKAKEKLENNYEFQNILVRLATKFINIPYQKQDESVNEILSITGDFISADRAFVFLYHFDKNLIEYRYEWVKKGIRPEINNIKYTKVEDFQTEWVDKHLRGESVFIPNVDNLDKTSMVYKILSSQDIKSVITIPLMNGSECLGFVGFDDVSNNRIWDTKERNLLNILAEIITNLLINAKKEKELTDAKEIAEKANIEKSSFLANVSHDIRTPLNGLFNVIELLRLSNVNSEQSQCLDIADFSIQSLNVLLSNVIDITKIEAGYFDYTPKSFDLEVLAFNVLNSQTFQANEKGLNLLFEYDNSINTYFYFDQTIISKILLNLIHNAIKYTEKGFVKLTIKKKHENNHGVIEFSIEDSGIGIEQHNLKYITDKFYTIKSNQKEHSTGLGLSITNLLLNALNSKLNIQSTPHKGSIFSFTLSMPIRETSQTYNPLSNKKIGVVLFNNHSISTINVLQTLPASVKVFSYDDPSLHDQDIIIWAMNKAESKYINIYETFKDNTPEIMHTILDVKNTFDEQTVKTLKPDYYSKHPLLRYPLLKQWKHFNNTFTNSISKNQLTKRKHILIIEDNRISQMTLASILQKNNYLVKTASTAEEGLSILKKSTINVLLLDVQLPKMQGDEFTKLIRSSTAHYQDVLIIGTTAHALKQDINTYLKSGMNHVLTKPFKIKELIEKIEGFNYPIPIKKSTFNTQDFDERFEGYSNIGYDMIKEFLNNYPIELKKLYKAFETKNDLEIHKALHHYKGTLSYLSADYLVQIIDELMQRNLNDNEIYALYEFINSETIHLVETLKTFLVERKHHYEK